MKPKPKKIHFLFLVLLCCGCIKSTVHIDQHNKPIPDYSIADLTKHNLWGVYASPKGEVWVVGELGVISHYNGSNWETQQSGTTQNLTAIYGNGTGLWAVGEGGAIVYYDGKSWEKQESGTGTTLTAIYGKGKEAWAIGNEGIIVYFDGDKWERQDSGTNEDLNAICGDGKNIWAVGGFGTVIGYEGGIWRLFPKITKNHLFSLFAKSGQVWAVGNFGTILHYEHDKWKLENSDTFKPLSAICGRGKELWAVGSSGTILHNEGAGWHPEVSNTDNYLFAVYASKTGVWAAGDNGTVVRYENGTWNGMTSNTTNYLNAVAGNKEGVWAIGYNGTIVHFNGKFLDLLESTMPNIHAFAGKGALIWGVGDHGKIIRFDGSGYQNMESNTENNLEAIYNDKKGLIAVGDSGTILRYDSGRWRLQKNITANNLRALYGDGDTTWAIGDKGTILYNVGDKLAIQSSQTLDNLNAIQGGESGIWAVGDHGIITHYNDNKWEIVASGTPFNLNAIYLNGKDGWIAGDQGTILHLKDGKWEPEGVNTADNLYTVSGYLNHVWVGGDNGTILHSTGGAWTGLEKIASESLNKLSATKDGLWITGNRGHVYFYNYDHWYSSDSFLYRPFDDGKHENSIFGNQKLTVVTTGYGMITFNKRNGFFPCLKNVTYKLLTNNKLDIYFYFDQNLGKRYDEQSKLEGIEYDRLYSEPFRQVTTQLRPEGKNALKATIDLNQFSGFDSKSAKLNKLFLRLVTQDGQYFTIRQSDSTPYLVIKDDFWENNKTLADVLLFVMFALFYYLFILFCSWAFPLKFLRFYGFIPIDQVCSKLPIPFDFIFSFFNILLPLSFFSRQTWVLDAWVFRHHQLFKDKFDRAPKVEQRNTYIPVPVLLQDIANKSRKNIDLPDPSVIEDAFRQKRALIQIVGDGGLGKTTFAIQFIRWLCYPNKTVKNSQPKFVLMIDSIRTDLPSTIKGLLTAYLPEEKIGDDFILSLLKKQRLIIFIDALSEFDAQSQKYIEEIHTNLPEANAIIITARHGFSFKNNEQILINTLPLSYKSGQNFINNYFEERYSMASFGKEGPIYLIDSHKAYFAARIFEIFTDKTNKGLPVIPIIVRILIDGFFDKFAFGKKKFEELIVDIPSSIPPVFYKYLEDINPQNSEIQNFLENETMIALAEIMGHLALGADYIPQRFLQKDFFGIADLLYPSLDHQTIKHRFIENHILEEINDLGVYRFGFLLDPLAEYLGAAYLYKQQAEKKTLNRFYSEVLNDTFHPKARGFKVAFLQVYEYFKTSTATR